jgi:hypothetical protein
MLLTATSRQRVYQFRHERIFIKRHGFFAGPHQRRRCNKSGMGGQGLPVRQIQEMGPPKLRAGRSAAADRSRQHLLDFDRDPVAVDKDHAGGNRQGIGEDLDLVCLGGVEFDDGTPAQAHYLMNRHRCGSQYHHEVDADFIEG